MYARRAYYVYAPAHLNTGLDGPLIPKLATCSTWGPQKGKGEGFQVVAVRRLSMSVRNSDITECIDYIDRYACSKQTDSVFIKMHSFSLPIWVSDQTVALLFSNYLYAAVFSILPQLLRALRKVKKSGGLAISDHLNIEITGRPASSDSLMKLNIFCINKHIQPQGRRARLKSGNWLYSIDRYMSIWLLGATYSSHSSRRPSPRNTSVWSHICICIHLRGPAARLLFQFRGDRLSLDLHATAIDWSPDPPNRLPTACISPLIMSVSWQPAIYSLTLSNLFLIWWCSTAKCSRGKSIWFRWFGCLLTNYSHIFDICLLQVRSVSRRFGSDDLRAISMWVRRVSRSDWKRGLLPPTWEPTRDRDFSHLRAFVDFSARSRLAGWKVLKTWTLFLVKTAFAWPARSFLRGRNSRNQLGVSMAHVALLFRHEDIKHLVKQWWDDLLHRIALAKSNKSVDVLITSVLFSSLKELEISAEDTSARHDPICLYWPWIRPCTVAQCMKIYSKTDRYSKR